MQGFLFLFDLSNINCGTVTEVTEVLNISPILKVVRYKHTQCSRSAFLSAKQSFVKL